MKIKNRKEFEDLLLANGWRDTFLKQPIPGHRPWKVVSPYDDNVIYFFGSKKIRTKDSSHVYGSVPNFRNISWEYHEDSGYITNGVFAIRIK